MSDTTADTAKDTTADTAADTAKDKELIDSNIDLLISNIKRLQDLNIIADKLSDKCKKHVKTILTMCNTLDTDKEYVYKIKTMLHNYDPYLYTLCDDFGLPGIDNQLYTETDVEKIKELVIMFNKVREHTMHYPPINIDDVLEFKQTGKITKTKTPIKTYGSYHTFVYYMNNAMSDQ
jgi:hypothetical protein